MEKKPNNIENDLEGHYNVETSFKENLDGLVKCCCYKEV